MPAGCSACGTGFPAPPQSNMRLQLTPPQSKERDSAHARKSPPLMRGPLGANTKKWHDTMNYAHDDYVMGHLLRFARASNRDTLIIDLMTGEADPTVLIQPPIEEVPGRYAAWLRDLVNTHQSDMRFVQAAGLTLRFDLQKSRTKRGTRLTESPYVCDVVITDDRAKEYSAHFEGWWYPELPDSAPREARVWWRFW
jgi:hypothetical protein